MIDIGDLTMGKRLGLSLRVETTRVLPLLIAASNAVEIFAIVISVQEKRG
jgi:hypothetical protein